MGATVSVADELIFVLDEFLTTTAVMSCLGILNASQHQVRCGRAADAIAIHEIQLR